MHKKAEGWEVGYPGGGGWVVKGRWNLGRAGGLIEARAGMRLTFWGFAFGREIEAQKLILLLKLN
jgi:hypothetical protein